MNRGGRPDEIRFRIAHGDTRLPRGWTPTLLRTLSRRRADRVDRPERPGVLGSGTGSAINSESPVRSASSMTDTRLCLSNTADPDGGRICDELRPKCVPKTSDHTTAALVLC